MGHMTERKCAKKQKEKKGKKPKGGKLCPRTGRTANRCPKVQQGCGLERRGTDFKYEKKNEKLGVKEILTLKKKKKRGAGGTQPLAFYRGPAGVTISSKH